ncbi:MAG: hypothetical protein UX73_C0035G0005 [candidate division WWE3 bacterium GW2011_GWC1_47_10]|uniref:Mannosyl-glycoprotein endo-beta-N-acetylglucosamidase-like domain-containing protein n=1 Tax=candidate division WWE3 bacterium GW2011_GWC1_47_10 TaxID=1619122 RepID=A0A0G1QX70_UNCKA|nr:MAG: hypothetical protein UX73_C0035G0005 [candidate division WWE3 bacterium GW2011_GWC1_47_10]
MEQITSLAFVENSKSTGEVKKSVNILIPIAWYLSSLAATFAVVVLLVVQISNPKLAETERYTIFAAKPLVLGTTAEVVNAADARPAKIDQFFRQHGCPLYGLGHIFVDEADRNNIPFWFVAAIAFQESSCGKLTPEVKSVESFNAWGWGVYGDNVRMFENWEHGVRVVSKYLADQFFSQGVTEPCEIMKVYTPPSTGSWCSGVEYFRNEIENYKTPLQGEAL